MIKNRIAALAEVVVMTLLEWHDKSRRAVPQILSGATLSALLAVSVSGAAQATLSVVDLVPGSGDNLIVRDDVSGLEWLKLTETMGYSVVDVIDDGAGGFVDKGFRLATADEAEGLFLAAGISPLSTSFSAGNFEPASLLIDLLGTTASGGGLTTTQGRVQAPDLPDYTLGAVAQVASCCPPSGKAYVLYVSALHKSVVVAGSGIFLVRPTTVLEVVIDIKPGSNQNTVNMSPFGVLPVAILSSNEFDATTIDPETIFLSSAQVRLAGQSGFYLCQERDVNRDGFADLVCGVEMATFADPGEALAELVAETFDGKAIRGEDIVRIVP